MATGTSRQFTFFCTVFLCMLGSIRASAQEDISDYSLRREIGRYPLILFAFDNAGLTPMNRRIMDEYVLPDVVKGSRIDIIGHTDYVGLAEYNLGLSERRAQTAVGTVRDEKKRVGYATLEGKGIGEEPPIYSNALPEARFYNRTVVITVVSPVAVR